MNAHIYTVWLNRKKVECVCGWSRNASTVVEGRRKHRAHAEKTGPMDQPMRLPKMPKYFNMSLRGAL